MVEIGLWENSVSFTSSKTKRGKCPGLCFKRLRGGREGKWEGNDYMKVPDIEHTPPCMTIHVEKDSSDICAEEEARSGRCRIPRRRGGTRKILLGDERQKEKTSRFKVT